MAYSSEAVPPKRPKSGSSGRFLRLVLMRWYVTNTKARGSSDRMLDTASARAILAANIGGSSEIMVAMPSPARNEARHPIIGAAGR